MTCAYTDRYYADLETGYREVKGGGFAVSWSDSGPLPEDWPPGEVKDGIFIGYRDVTVEELNSLVRPLSPA